MFFLFWTRSVDVAYSFLILLIPSAPAYARVLKARNIDATYNFLILLIDLKQIIPLEFER